MNAQGNRLKYLIVKCPTGAREELGGCIPCTMFTGHDCGYYAFRHGMAVQPNPGRGELNLADAGIEIMEKEESNGRN